LVLRRNYGNVLVSSLGKGWREPQC
jgi:hypothetical protein